MASSLAILALVLAVVVLTSWLTWTPPTDEEVTDDDRLHAAAVLGGNWVAPGSDQLGDDGTDTDEQPPLTSDDEAQLPESADTAVRA